MPRWYWFSCEKSRLEVEFGHHLCRGGGLICDTGLASWRHDYTNEVRAQGSIPQENHVFRRWIGESEPGSEIQGMVKRSGRNYKCLNGQGKRTFQGKDSSQYREVEKNEMWRKDSWTWVKYHWWFSQVVVKWSGSQISRIWEKMHGEEMGTN